MGDLILTTFDWVPEMPRGYVRDLRVRWALEEAGLPYRVESTPFRDRNVEHFSHQPFGQVPWLTDGDISIFESGAILLHLAERSDALMSADPHCRSEVKEWLFAALNSVEAASLPWSILIFTGEARDTSALADVLANLESISWALIARKRAQVAAYQSRNHCSAVRRGFGTTLKIFDFAHFSSSSIMPMELTTVSNAWAS
jgi:glutathione S-transferase